MSFNYVSQWLQQTLACFICSLPTLTSSLCNDDDDSISGIGTLWVAGEKDIGEAGTVPTLALCRAWSTEVCGSLNFDLRHSTEFD